MVLARSPPFRGFSASTSPAAVQWRVERARFEQWLVDRHDQAAREVAQLSPGDGLAGTDSPDDTDSADDFGLDPP